jgi:hypothetical protein
LGLGSGLGLGLGLGLGARQVARVHHGQAEGLIDCEGFLTHEPGEGWEYA